MRRVTVFDRSGGYAGELDPSRVFALTRKDAVNGEHSLTIVTSIGLEKGQRILMQDDRGYWREFAVYGADVSHDSAGAPVGTYYCVWSLQADLMGTRVDAMPGTQTPVAAATALDAVLENTSRWARGTVTNTNTGGASMYDTDGWSALSILIGTWGGEVDATIQADGFGVTARKVDLYSQQGDQEAKRRFDFGEDLQSVRRIIADGPLYCRVTPRGAGEQTDAGGYGRKITIESVNGGKDYLEDAEMTDLAKLPDGNGGWEYPTVEIENSECEEPAELKSWAQSVMQEHTRPKVTYEVDVIQLAREGIDMQGVSLGDAVQVVDRKFGGLRMTARVLEISVDELSGKSVALTLGSVREGLSSLFGSIGAQLATIGDAVQVMNGGTFSTDGYLSNLLGRLNVQINGTGGYTYITEGQGIRTYDRAVSNPLVGAEATSVVEIKGGSIRIANSKTAQGAWNWKTVFTSGHIAANLVTAANITTGYIGSPSGNYWNLDTGELRMSVSVDVGVANMLMDTDRTDLNAHAAVDKRYISDSANANYISSRFFTLPIGGVPIPGVKTAIEFTMTSTVGKRKRGLCFYSGGSVAMAQNNTYTISCYARSVSGSGGVQFQVGNGPYMTSSAFKVTGAWRQYSWTFTYTNAATGGSNGTRVYFMAVGNNAAGKVQLCGFKLERGTTATEYAASTADLSYDDEKTFTDAQLYANTLNESLNQEKILKRLTNNGQAKGVFMKNGQLYVNANYVKSGTIDAALIKAGLIQDVKKLNSWNMTTGALTTKSLAISAGNVTGTLKMAQNPSTTKNYIAVTPNGLDFIGNQGVGLRIRQGSDRGREMIQIVDVKASGNNWNTALDIRSSIHTAGVLKRGTHRSGYVFSKDTPYSGYGVTTVVPIGFKKYVGGIEQYVTHHLYFVNGILVEVR